MKPKTVSALVRLPQSQTHVCGAALLAAGLALSATQTHAQEACTTYTVQRGDTLSQISDTAGVRGGYQVLFSANRAVLGSPNQLEVGQRLQIPCADGALPGAATTVAAPAGPATAATRPIRIITANGYAPFTDESLPGRGLFTRLVERAMEEGNPEQEFSLFFVNDWGSQLDSLLPSGAIDMAFPWFRPDCSKLENLSASNARRCTEFNHSVPFYDAAVGYYTLAGSDYAGVSSYEELQGARLCRPEEWFTFDLESLNLVEPIITLKRAATQVGCWELLMDGEVDVVTYDALPAEEDYAENDFPLEMVELDALASKQTLHVFVSKDNEIANAALPILNEGFKKLLASGEWFQIVHSGIVATLEN